MPAVDETVERIVALANANDPHAAKLSVYEATTYLATIRDPWRKALWRAEFIVELHRNGPNTNLMDQSPWPCGRRPCLAFDESDGRLAAWAVLLAGARLAAGVSAPASVRARKQSAVIAGAFCGSRVSARSNIATAPFQVDLLAPLKFYKMAKPRTVRSDCVEVVELVRAPRVRLNLRRLRGGPLLHSQFAPPVCIC
jgi:hypothetical protein